MSKIKDLMESHGSSPFDKTNDMTDLSSEVDKLSNLQDEIKASEDKISELKREEQRLSVIPTLLAESGFTSIKLADGSSLEVKPYYNASIAIRNRDAAYNWLRENGLGDIIKNEVAVSFGRDEDTKAMAYANLAKSQGFEPAQKLKVEPMTLKAMVRERVEKNLPVPEDLFNVFVGNRTTIKRKK
jgi:hypothetical protein